MDLRKLGKSNLTVPVIGMGTWRTFDVRGAKAETNCLEVVRKALEIGIRFFDSSPMYAEAERVLGSAIEQLGVRDKVLIATKVWSESDSESERQFENAFRFFASYVDLYQVHNLVAWQKRLANLEKLKAAGKVRSIGITHYWHGRFIEMLRIMETDRIDTIQVPYNALDRKVEEEILPLAASLNVGVVIMKPFEQGSLLNRSPSPEELEPFEDFGVKTWPQILLKWIASDPRVSIVIPATSRPENAAENALAGDPPWFDPDTREKVRRLARRYS